MATCRLLITFANSLDPDQDRQNVGPDLDPKPFDNQIMFLKEFFEEVNFKKRSADNNKNEKNTQHTNSSRSTSMARTGLGP